MKRALLIATGTVGGLGAILAITPPQLSSTTQIAGGIPQATPTAAPSASATATAQPTTKPTKKPAAKPTARAQPTTAPTAAQPSGATNDSFTGDAVSMRYGIVQVKITVQNGKITDAQALQAPTGSNDRYTQMAVPRLREQTITAQSANIQGVSGASFTSYGWYKSLVSAIAKAGL
ncbi:MAG: FMN-binding protein [Actinomycetes bacterium]